MDNISTCKQCGKGVAATHQFCQSCSQDLLPLALAALKDVLKTHNTVKEQHKAHMKAKAFIKGL